MKRRVLKKRAAREARLARQLYVWHAGWHNLIAREQNFRRLRCLPGVWKPGDVILRCSGGVSFVTQVS
jgi:hypothetical protein